MTKQIDSVMICTSNKKKFEEISIILKALNINTIMPPKELEIDEYANTFLSNAYLKAKAYYEVYKTITLADDSGLEIEAFGNKPGVYSARFYQMDFGNEVLTSHEKNTLPKDELNNLKVLRLLEKEENRRAKFVSAVVLMLDEHKGIFGEGYLEGIIAKEPSGNMGFGYDPIFIPNGYDKTLANIGNKNDFSHRKKAIEAIVSVLKNLL